MVSIDPATKKSKVDYTVVSFTRSDDLKQFETEFEKAVDTLKKQTEQGSK